MNNIKIKPVNANLLKDQLEYHRKHKILMPFDKNHIQRIENIYDVRFINAHISGYNLNVYAYALRNDQSYTTSMAVKNFVAHTTSMRFANELCDLLIDRAHTEPDTVKDDDILKMALKSIDKPQVQVNMALIKKSLECIYKNVEEEYSGAYPGNYGRKLLARMLY